VQACFIAIPILKITCLPVVKSDMQQLCLNIIPRLSYVPENFILHSGTRCVVDEVTELVLAPKFRFFLIYGEPRSGKTHLSLYFAQCISQRGVFPVLLESEEIFEWHPDAGKEIDQDSVVIVDDAEKYLALLKRVGPGSFVQLYEHCRKRNARLVFLCRDESVFPGLDDHAMSRIATAHSYHLAPPDGTELPLLVKMMARQRGLDLSSRKQGFLVRRVGRDIESVEKYLNRLVFLSQVLDKKVRFSLLSDALLEEAG